MQSNPIVSIGVPVHNGAAFILGCIENLLAQDYPNFIINIFENCSTDGTAELVSQYSSDARIRIHPATEFLSAVDNFLRAWEYVSTENDFFMLIACDDRVSPNYLSAGFLKLQENPTKCVAAGTVYHVSPSGEQSLVRMSAQSIDADAFRSFPNALKKRQFPAPLIYGLYRGKECVLTIRQALQDFPSAWGNDRLAVRYFVLRGKFLYVPEMQFYFLTGSQSAVLYGAATKSERLNHLLRYFRALWSERSTIRPLRMLDRVKYAIWCFRCAEADTTYSIEKILLK